jgi:hypothetical protein
VCEFKKNALYSVTLRKTCRPRPERARISYFAEHEGPWVRFPVEGNRVQMISAMSLDRKFEGARWSAGLLVGLCTLYPQHVGVPMLLPDNSPARVFLRPKEHVHAEA